MAVKVEVLLDKELYATKHKRYSFKYVWYKSQLLEQWLLSRGELPRRRVFTSHYGTAAGFEVYIELVAQVETHCGQWNVDCLAMLCPDLIPFEGREIFIGWLRGKTSKGRIERAGRRIKYHMIIKDGNKVGAKIDPWNIGGAMLTPV